MSSNRLKLNAYKTEFIWLGTRQQLRKIIQKQLGVGGANIASVSKVHDLGVIIDDELTMAAHVRHPRRQWLFLPAPTTAQGPTLSVI